MIDFFKNLTPQIQAAIIAAITAILTTILSFITKSWIEKKVLINKLESEYKYEQQKKLKALLAKNKMRLLNSAEALNHRLWNFMENHSEPWLNKRGNYYNSFVYRFITFFAYIRQIEKELIYIDSTFAGKADLEFIKFLRTFPQLFCDVKLFKGENYDKNVAADHFFRNNFENFCDSFICQNEIVTYLNFIDDIDKYGYENKKLFEYFDSISINESRYRFDLIKTFHLTIIAFLNTYGYDFQQTTLKQINEVLEIPRKSRLYKNYKDILVRNKLNKNKWIDKIINNKHFA
jgi:hypothetical protein